MLKKNWTNILDSIDKLKDNQTSIDNFIVVYKSLLEIVTDAARAETDDNLSKTIQDSSRLLADTLNTAQESTFKSFFFFQYACFD